MRQTRTLLAISAILVAWLGAHGDSKDAPGSKDPAIPTARAAWSARFEQPVLWQRVLPIGALVVATDCCLHGVDPTSGSIAWKREGLEGPSEASFESLYGTPLFVINVGRRRDRSLVVDSTDGHVVFDSEAAGIASILHRTVLFDSGGLLILGQQRGDPTIKLIYAEMATGKIRWTNDQVLGKASPGMKKLAGALARLAQTTAAASGGSVASVRPVEVGSEAVILPCRGEISKLSTHTGEYLWRVPNRSGDGDTEIFLPPSRPDLFVAGTEVVGQGTSTNGATPVQTQYSAYRLADGGAVWPKAIKVAGRLNSPVLLDQGLIVSSGGGVKGDLKFVEYATGNSIWGKNGKGIDSDGGIVDYRTTDLGLVVTTGYDSAWSNKGTIYSLNVLDVKAGAYRYPKSVRVKGRVLTTELVPKGLLVVTTHQVDIFDPGTGELLLGQAVASDALATAEDGTSLYAFAPNAGALWRIDKREAKATRLTSEKIQLDGDDLPRALEVSASRVTLLGSQHVIGFDRDGKVLFRTYYPAPRHPAWVRALLIAQSVRAGMAAAEAGLASAAVGQYASTREDGTLEREVGEEMAHGYAKLAEGAAGLSSGYARMARQRFHASAETRDFQFMMVDLERGHGIAQVDKLDGSIRNVIPIGKDKAPSYEVDDVTQRVYYRSDDRTVQGYSFEEGTSLARATSEPAPADRAKQPVDR